MDRLAAIVRAVETGLRAIAALCLISMFLLIIAQVLLRYLGGGIPVFTEEVARYAMIWSTLFASAVAVREGSHIRIDLLPTVLNSTAPALGRALEFLLDTLTLGLVLVIFWQGIDMVQFATGQRSEGLRISLAWPYAAIPISFGFAAVFALARLVSKVRSS
jgi:TRAP-type transport system small permease protein